MNSLLGVSGGPCEDCRNITTETRATRVGRSMATIFLCTNCDDNRGITAKASLLHIERPQLSSKDIAEHLALETKRPVSYTSGIRFPFKFEMPAPEKNERRGENI